MPYWVSIAGLSLLALMWLRTLISLLRDEDLPAEWTLNEDTPPDPVDGLYPSLSVIIPARNEEDNIESCVRSAMNLDWPGALEVVVLDDRSTDGTGSVLAALETEFPELKVIQGRDPTDGWLGKPHALHIAQAAATGEWLWFVDADVVLNPQGARRLIGRTVLQDAEMSSALGRLDTVSFWERVIQTRLGALIAGGNPLVEVNDAEHERALANGQCLLFRRDAYDRLGGHEAIKGSVLDDVDFAKRAKAEGVSYRLFYGPGVFSCRMYRGLNEIWHGWSKNLFPALDYSLIATAIITALLFAGTVLPFVLLAKNAWLHATGTAVAPAILWLEVFICALIFIVDAVGHKVRGYRWGLFWTFPIGMMAIIILFWNSAIRITTGAGAVWKGRVVEQGRPRKTDDLENSG